MVALVALLVIGPERLPGAARVAGLWLGRFKRGFTAIREDVEREIGADEIRRELHNENILAKERKLLEETVQHTKNNVLEVTQVLNEPVLSESTPTAEEPPKPPASAQIEEQK